MDMYQLGLLAGSAGGLFKMAADRPWYQRGIFEERPVVGPPISDPLTNLEVNKSIYGQPESAVPPSLQVMRALARHGINRGSVRQIADSLGLAGKILTGGGYANPAVQKALRSPEAHALYPAYKNSKLHSVLNIPAPIDPPSHYRPPHLNILK